LLKHRDCLVALHGLYLLPLSLNLRILMFQNITIILGHFIYINMTNYIKYNLKTTFNFNSDSFFNEKKYGVIAETYKELNISFLFSEYKSMDFKIIILSAFNDLVYNKICEILVKKPTKNTV